MRGNEDGRMATTQLYRCDLNTFSLHQQCCSIIEAVQLSGKIYIYIYFNYAEVTSLGIIQESFYCVAHSVCLDFLHLHLASLKERGGVSTVTWHRRCGDPARRRPAYKGSFHFTVLNRSLSFCIDNVTQTQVHILYT